MMKEAYEIAFFLMQVVYYLDSGHYCDSRRELLSGLTSTEREIIEAGMDFLAWLETHSGEQARHAYRLVPERAAYCLNRTLRQAVWNHGKMALLPLAARLMANQSVGAPSLLWSAVSGVMAICRASCKADAKPVRNRASAKTLPPSSRISPISINSGV